MTRRWLDKQAHLVVLAALAAALLAAPFALGRGDLRLLTEMLCMLALAQMWNLLAGYMGLISIGQHAFVGFGGYVFFALAVLAGVPLLWALPLVLAAGVAVALPTGLLAFRLSGPYFAVGTWVIAEVYRLLAAQVSSLGGGSGISLPIALVRDFAAHPVLRDRLIYWLCLGLALIVVLGSWWLMRTRVGLALTAMGDSEQAAQSCGVPTQRLKRALYVVIAALSALIGALIFLQKLRISPAAAFSLNDWTITIIFIAVLGGIGTLEGPILGVIVYFLLREYFSQLGNWYMVMLGVVSIGIMLFEPKGLWGIVQRHTRWRLFPVRHRLNDQAEE
ncbi:MAG TPA: branched-chain amino acid ABC transporter permease [Thermopetrobacter sp.]|nr:branched-chain amino acid ABC transporter permease [Thermopetrobacter sp.]